MSKVKTSKTKARAVGSAKQKGAAPMKKSAKKADAAKKAATAKKAAPAKPAPSKKAAPAKPAPSKKAAPAKQAAPAPAKKAAPAQKAAPAPAKKAAPAQKAAPAPAKKGVPSKQQTPAKPAPAKPAPSKRAAPTKKGEPTKKGKASESDKRRSPDAEDEEPDSERAFRRRSSSDEVDEDAGDDFDDDFDGDADDESDDASPADDVEDDDFDDDDAPDSDVPVRGRGGEVGRAVQPAVAIPLPVKELPRVPTLEERAAALVDRLARQSTDFRRAYDDSFDMSWVFHDTGLEGMIYTFDELQSAFRSIDVGHLDSSVVPIFQAIKRNKDAIDLVRKLVANKLEPLSLDLIRRIYVTLHPDEGDVKTAKYRRDIPQHRLYFHEYAPPDKIALKLRALVDWMIAPDSMKSAGPLKLAARAHYDLARIYPFPKDSGKVARLLMNLILMRAGYPPAIMHHSERQRYYDALKAPTPAPLVQMVRDAVENSITSIEKLLDDREARQRSGKA